MLTNDIVKQLQAEIPQRTDDFSEKEQIISASQTINDLTIGVDLDDEPKVNSSIIIEGLKLSNEVVLEEAIGNTIKLTFTKKHDVTLTQGYKEVYLKNTDSEKNGLYYILEVGEKYIIFNTTETGFTALIENRAGFNGLFKIKSVNTDEIVIDLGFTNTLPFYITDAYIQYGARIYGIAFIKNIDKYITTFIKSQPATTGKPFIFVLNSGTNVDSDKTTGSDINSPQNAGSGMKITKIRNFDVIAIFPTNQSVGGFQATTKAEQLELILDQCLFGLILPTYTQTESKDMVVPLGNSPLSFNGSFYSHLYRYEVQYYQGNEDGYKYPSYKFREFEINYKLEFDDYEEIKKIDTILLESEN